MTWPTTSSGILVIFLLLATLIASGASLAPDGDNSITLLGPRIVISLLPGTSCLDLKQPGHETPYRVCFDSLHELNPEGRLVSSFSFPNLTWLKYSNFTSANATSTLPNNAVVTLAALLFVNETSYRLGNVSFDIPQNDLMWRLEIASWPFLSSANTLALNWSMSHPSMSSWTSFNSTVPYASTTLEIAADGIPNWLLAVFHACLVDNTTRYNVSVEESFQSGVNSSRLNVQLHLPYFQSNVRMLSVTWIASPHGSAITLPFILGVAGVCLAVLVIGTVIGIVLPYYLLRKNYKPIS